MNLPHWLVASPASWQREERAGLLFSPLMAALYTPFLFGPNQDMSPTMSTMASMLLSWLKKQ